METTVIVSALESSPEAIRAVAHQLALDVEISILAVEHGQIQVTVRRISERFPDPETLRHELRRSFLDQQVRLDLEKRTGPLRELIYRAAFAPVEQPHGWWKR